MEIPRELRSARVGATPPGRQAQGGARGPAPGGELLQQTGPNAGTPTAQPPLGSSVPEPQDPAASGTRVPASTRAAGHAGRRLSGSTRGGGFPARDDVPGREGPGLFVLSTSWEEEPACGLCEPRHTPGLAACPTHLAWRTWPGTPAHRLGRRPLACLVSSLPGGCPASPGRALLSAGRAGLTLPPEVLISEERCVRDGLAFLGAVPRPQTLHPPTGGRHGPEPRAGPLPPRPLGAAPLSSHTCAGGLGSAGVRASPRPRGPFTVATFPTHLHQQLADFHQLPATQIQDDGVTASEASS